MFGSGSNYFVALFKTPEDREIESVRAILGKDHSFEGKTVKIFVEYFSRQINFRGGEEGEPVSASPRVGV